MLDFILRLDLDNLIGGGKRAGGSQAAHIVDTRQNLRTAFVAEMDEKAFIDCAECIIRFAPSYPCQRLTAAMLVEWTGR